MRKGFAVIREIMDISNDKIKDTNGELILQYIEENIWRNTILYSIRRD